MSLFIPIQLDLQNQASEPDLASGPSRLSRWLPPRNPFPSTVILCCCVIPHMTSMPPHTASCGRALQLLLLLHATHQNRSLPSPSPLPLQSLASFHRSPPHGLILRTRFLFHPNLNSDTDSSSPPQARPAKGWEAAFVQGTAAPRPSRAEPAEPYGRGVCGKYFQIIHLHLGTSLAASVLLSHEALPSL